MDYKGHSIRRSAATSFAKSGIYCYVYISYNFFFIKCFLFHYTGAGMQEFMDWGKWKSLKIGQRYISQSATTKMKHASRLSLNGKEDQSLFDTPYHEIERSMKKKSFGNECINGKSFGDQGINKKSFGDDGIDYKELYLKEMKKNQRKRKIEEVYDYGDYGDHGDYGYDKKENERKRFKDDDGYDRVKGEFHGLYYIEDGQCYKETTEDAANKDGFYIYRRGKYYKRLDE